MGVLDSAAIPSFTTAQLLELFADVLDPPLKIARMERNPKIMANRVAIKAKMISILIIYDEKCYTG